MKEASDRGKYGLFEGIIVIKGGGLRNERILGESW